MKFKVGDKVKILDGLHCYGSETGIVLDISPLESFPIKVLFATKQFVNWCAYRENELEPFVEIGQQLLFPFMREE